MSGGFDLPGAILATIREPLLVLDADLRVVLANRAFYRLFQVTPEETEGRLVYELGSRQWDIPGLRRLLEAILPENTLFEDYEVRAAFPGLGTRTMLVNARRLSTEGGRTDLILLAVEDVTERRRAEEALRRSAAHLARVTAVGPAVLYTMAVEGTALVPTWVSANITDRFGYTAEEALGRDWWASRLHPDDRDAALAAASTIFARGYLSHEYRFRRQDGSDAWIRDSLRLIRNGEGAPREVIGAWLDVTEAKQTEAQLLQAQKMESIGRLAGGVAHDFNNILAVIMGAAELASRSLREGDPLLARLSQIRESAQRAAGVTRPLLAFARRQVFQPRVVNLNMVVRATGDLLRRLLGEDIRLVVREGADLWNVRVDPTQIEQVIMNLAVNSRDAMPRGGTLTIETANVEVDDACARQHLEVTPGPYVVLAVTDTGTGMDEATRRHAFEPFFTTKPPGSGTGLGLATVHGIVRQSGGGVWLYSELGRGTTVKIYLPRVLEPVGPGPVPPGAPVELRRGTETVLVVEDDEAVRRVIVEALGATGYTPLAAATPSEALALARAHTGPLHLLVSDVVMPAMSGPDLAARLRAIRPEMRVLYVSGYAAGAPGVVALDPAATLLSKPFDLTTLARKVREVLDAPAAGSSPAGGGSA